MPLVDNAWYVNYGDGSAGAGKKSWFDVTVWATGTVTAAGTLRRQTAPAVGNERVFVCIVAGTTHATTEPTWILTRGAKTTDNTVTWQECTGIAALNGDATNTPSWTITATPPGGVKNTAVVLGQVIKRDSGASYQICTTAGTAGNGAEPSFSDTAGTTTADNTVTWTSLGVVGNFTGWQAPFARLANAFASTWGQVGNTFFIGDNHAETQTTTITLLAPLSASSPCSIYCVDRSVAVPPGTGDLKTTATISTTTTAAAYTIGGCYAFYYGISFICNPVGTGQQFNIATGSGNAFNLYFKSCSMQHMATVAAPFQMGTSQGNRGGLITFDNTTLKVGSTGISIGYLGGTFRWINAPSGVITGALIPTTLFDGGNASGSDIQSIYTIQGVDLSAITGTLVGTNLTYTNWTFIDCKLAGGVVITPAASTIANYAQAAQVDLIRCDSAATNYRHERYRFAGTQVVDTTIIRTGGASDGTTPISWKIVTSAYSKWIFPYETFQIVIWNDDISGAIDRVTIYGTTTGGGVPNNDDIWIEVEYLGDASFPMGSFVTTTKANNLAASTTTNNSSDASTWGGGGAGNGFKMVTPSFTVNQKGYISVVVKVAKVSSTYYIDPLIVLS